MAQEEKRYLGESGLISLVENIKNKFSQLGHKHTKSEITDLEADNELSTTSENPVQNKVIKAELDTKVPVERTVNGKTLDADINLNASDVGTMTSEEIASELDTKADAVEVAYIDIEDTITLVELPEVTEKDNGKILQVVDGEWTAVTIPNGSEEVW